jgi:hypothetical protein
MIKNKLCYSYDTEIPTDVTVGALGFYAHGKLEDVLEHDIVLVPCSDIFNTVTNQYEIFLEEGISNVQIMLNDNVIDCILYFWSAEDDTKRGLFVFQDDIDSNVYAENNYNLKSRHI